MVVSRGVESRARIAPHVRGQRPRGRCARDNHDCERDVLTPPMSFLLLLFCGMSRSEGVVFCSFLVLNRREWYSNRDASLLPGHLLLLLRRLPLGRLPLRLTLRLPLRGCLVVLMVLMVLV